MNILAIVGILLMLAGVAIDKYCATGTTGKYEPLVIALMFTGFIIITSNLWEGDTI